MNAVYENNRSPERVDHRTAHWRTVHSKGTLACREWLPVGSRWEPPGITKEEKLWVGQQSYSQVFTGGMSSLFVYSDPESRLLPVDKEYLTPKDVQRRGHKILSSPVLEDSSRLCRGFCYSRVGCGLCICRVCSLKVNRKKCYLSINSSAHSC